MLLQDDAVDMNDICSLVAVGVYVVITDVILSYPVLRARGAAVVAQGWYRCDGVTRCDGMCDAGVDVDGGWGGMATEDENESEEGKAKEQGRGGERSRTGA